MWQNLLMLIHEQPADRNGTI
uniref:Uncharacterized protein n=1 Tax=Anguilla anguilla TaxID=7936 RepID=A0A0E9TYV6_ANGAN